MDQEKPLNALGLTLLATFFILLVYAGFLSYQSIDWDVLKRLENSPLVLPPPITPQPVTTSALPSVSATRSAQPTP